MKFIVRFGEVVMIPPDESKTMQALAELSDGGGAENPTTDDYFFDLNAQRNSLAETLQEAGVEASTEETLSTLIPKANKKIADENIVNDPYTAFFEVVMGAPIDGQPTKAPGGLFKGATTMPPYFDTSKITNFKEWFHTYKCETIPPYDFSNATSVYNIFYWCDGLKYLPDLDFSKATDNQGLFRAIWGCLDLVSIKSLKMPSGKGIPQIWGDTKKVTSLTIKGTLDADVNLQGLPLDMPSAKSVMLALADFSNTENVFEYSVYFSPTTLEYIEAEGATAPNGLKWKDYVMNKGYNM